MYKYYRNVGENLLKYIQWRFSRVVKSRDKIIYIGVQQQQQQ